MTLSPRTAAAICLAVAAAALFPTLLNDFTTWDDPQYVLDNPLVRSLSPGSVLTLFTTPEYAGNYHPVTLLAVAVQYALFGVSPLGYHMVSLLLHLGVTYLVFRFTLNVTRTQLAAVGAALIFGVHPLHLEPVAWAADQKDLLYAIFYLAAVLAWLRYRETGEVKFLFRAALPFFVLSLLSKGLAVTLPVTLVLLDYHRDRKISITSLKPVTPFFALSAVFGILAIRAQAAAGALAEGGIDGPVEIFLYACKGYVLYVARMIVPIGLSPWYPYPLDVPASYWVYPVLAVVIVTAAFLSRKKYPFVFLGLAWYTVTVAPVLQFLQVGNAEMADRYAYLPSLGHALIAGWGFAMIAGSAGGKKSNTIPAIAGGLYIIILSVVTFSLAPVWRDGTTLWTRVIERYPDSPKGWFNRGHAHHTSERFAESVSDYTQAVSLNPEYPFAWSNRGLSYFFLRDWTRALGDFDRELLSRPADPDIRFWRANVLAALGRYDEAAADLTTVLEGKPGNLEATIRRGLIYTSARDFPKAEADFSRAISISPSDPNLYFNRGNVRAGLNHWDDAISDYSKVLTLTPGDRDAFYARGIAFYLKGDTASACGDLRQASALGSSQADTAIADICR